MEYRALGKTELKVSVIGLGTMTWGEQNTEVEAHEQLDFALEHGVNFIDTAEIYPVLPRAETYSRTESFIGTWIKARQNRDQYVLATKIAGSAAQYLNWLRNGENRLNRKNIEQALNDSLKRLNTDYIDLYQLHWPDRPTNFFGQLGYTHQPDGDATPIEETLSVLNDLVKAGKIRHVGLSNETPWGMMQFLNKAEQHRYPRVASIQNPYSLLNRSFEIGLAEMAIREQCGLLAYSPLGFGVLSGKYIDNAAAPNARLNVFGNHFSRYSNPQAQSATEHYVQLAKDSGLSPAQMALAFVNSRDFVTSNIIGATTMAQLKENIESASLQLPREVLAQIEAIHVEYPNPSP